MRKDMYFGYRAAAAAITICLCIFLSFSIPLSHRRAQKGCDPIRIGSLSLSLSLHAFSYVADPTAESTQPRG